MRSTFLVLSACAGALAAPCAVALGQERARSDVRLERVPDAGLQPRTARGADGSVHLVYFKGDLKQGNVMYARRAPGEARFGAPVRVNTQDGSAAAGGTIRGPALAVEPDGRAHVVWCGSAIGMPRAPLNPGQPKESEYNGTPLLYARSDGRGGFEPQRNMMTASWALDGGPAVAADSRGNISVVWHAGHAKGAADESGRAVFVSRSSNHGAAFASEVRVDAADDGACACCGLAAGADGQGTLAVLYRRAARGTLRDMMLLLSDSGGTRWVRTGLEGWEINACPMTTACVVADGETLLVAWETRGSVSLARVDPATGKIVSRAVPPGDGGSRKYPAIAVDAASRVLLAWAEGAGWAKGGSVAWQVFGHDLKAIEGAGGRQAGLEAWTFPAPLAEGDSFVILY